MIKHFRNTSIIFFLTALIGCSSPPRMVNADIPLVNETNIVSDEIVPSRYWPTLNDKFKTQFTHNDYQVQVGSIYDSALGTHCRTLTFSLEAKKIGSRIACANIETQGSNTWFLTKDVLDEQTKVGLK